MKKVGKLFIVFFAVFSLVMVVTAASAADMSGTWECSVQTPQGSGTPYFDLKQDGNKLSGEYEGAFGKSKVGGTVDGNNFAIEYTMGGTKIVYKGTVEGNKAKGTADFGGQATGPFTCDKK